MQTESDGLSRCPECGARQSAETVCRIQRVSTILVLVLIGVSLLLMAAGGISPPDAFGMPTEGLPAVAFIIGLLCVPIALHWAWVLVRSRVGNGRVRRFNLLIRAGEVAACIALWAIGAVGCAVVQHLCWQTQ